MPTIPALTNISGEVSAAPHNNNYSAIRTYVNTYCAFLDQNNTFTGTTQTFPAIVATSGTFSGTVAVTGGAKATATDGTATVQVWCSSGQARIETAGAHAMSLGTNGSARWVLTSGGMLLAQTDNTYDIGAAGAQRPRNVYIAGTLNVGGVTTLGATDTGALTCTTLAPSGASTLQAVTCTTLAPSSTTTLSSTGATYAIDFTGAAPRVRIANNGSLTFVENDGSTAIMTLTESTRAVAFGGVVSITGIVTCSTDVVTGSATALATSATAGFLWIPATNGVPAGTPSPEYGDRIALTYNYAANALYAYNPVDNTWRAV